MVLADSTHPEHQCWRGFAVGEAISEGAEERADCPNRKHFLSTRTAASELETALHIALEIG